MPNTKKKAVPKFRSENEEREFWAKHDSTQFIDWQSAEHHKFTKLKRTWRTIVIAAPVRP